MFRSHAVRASLVATTLLAHNIMTSTMASCDDASPCPQKPIATSALSSIFGSSPSDYTSNPLYRRIPPPPSFKKNHAIYENVLHPNCVAKYNVYRSPTEIDAATGAKKECDYEVVIADLEFGDKGNGHKGVVHGGITSLLFDDAFGFAYFIASRGLMGYTANLNINYRSPLPEKSKAVMRIKLDKIERRKVMLKGRLESHDGKVVYSEATALYIVDRSMTKMKIEEDLKDFVE
mmetsp:Transcript_21523/g.44881  ORF Transcript_21523/g.44881 Transcript_21523/m.44881 type:complete len:233 (-) Transcript_21523:47-745(-)